ncbi:Arginine-tRNA ligase, class Ia [Artemisia annua]|uniref:Arginine-tRNA ligase, class Ia n=1 Tax=Artemisia annua TaxID=35608 RepID=A0A2U1N947_ARTAN|nr:Arginine-tRNA ligase, class Ia [Artemisia annua]
MASTSTLTTKDKVIKKHGKAVLTLEIDFELNEGLQKSYVPLLKNEFPFFKRLKGDRKKFGDYMCYNILHVCEVLRSEDPQLFKKTPPKAIAQVIKDNFPKSDMLEEVKIHDIGFLTFKLSGPWMIERIKKNLTVGIAEWAPIMPFKRVIIDFPHNDFCQSFRSICIRDVLVRMLEYCGVEVSGRMQNKKSLDEEEALLDQPQPNNVHEDLAALWCGGYEQKAQWIVYVTPVWQREYVMQCFNAAREFLDEHHTTLSYLGYETVSDEEEILAQLLMYEPLVMKKESWLNCFGYSYEAIVEGTMKYAYLKTLTYSGCTLNTLDLLNIEGDTFIHLLSVQSRIKSCFIRPHHHKSHKELSDREREIIQDSILKKVPYLLCEYLYALSNNISSYILEDEFSESGVLLCKAAGVVMWYIFDLLGITPECPLRMKPYLEKKHADKHQIIRGDHYISSSSPSRTYELRSRFEMFSMSIEAPFDEGNLFGGIMVTDTFGLRSDNWCDMDKKGRGQVNYFFHNWDDAVKFCDNSLITFGD